MLTVTTFWSFVREFPRDGMNFRSVTSMNKKQTRATGDWRLGDWAGL
ncbi:MAG: hypothetical protein OSA98_25480 [Rubripirellula sp.]|nr:hypothetical protein [Rubripirellula sp.]